LTQNIFWKEPPPKRKIYFMNWKPSPLKNDFNPKTKLANQRGIWFCTWVA
jgi:hypothetical protein